MKHINFKDVHVGQTYLYGDRDEEVVVLHKNTSTKLATVEFQEDMRLRSVIAEQLRPVKVSAVPAYKTGDRRVFRPIDTVEAEALAVQDLWGDRDREEVSGSAVEEIKDALSSLARDLGEDGADDEDDHESDDDFEDDGDEAPHVWGTVDPYQGMSPSSLGSFSELLYDLGFDMSLVELKPKSVTFKDTAMGFLNGLLSIADEPEGYEEE